MQLLKEGVTQKFDDLATEGLSAMCTKEFKDMTPEEQISSLKTYKIIQGNDKIHRAYVKLKEILTQAKAGANCEQELAEENRKILEGNEYWLNLFSEHYHSN